MACHGRQKHAAEGCQATRASNCTSSMHHLTIDLVRVLRPVLVSVSVCHCDLRPALCFCELDDPLEVYWRRALLLLQDANRVACWTCACTLLHHNGGARKLQLLGGFRMALQIAASVASAVQSCVPTTSTRLRTKKNLRGIAYK